MEYRRTIVSIVMWLTRVFGAVFVVAGLSCFVSAWMERTLDLIWLGIPIIAFGVFTMSVRASPTGDLEYGLLKRRG